MYLGLLEEAKIFQPSTKVFGVFLTVVSRLCVYLFVVWGHFLGGGGERVCFCLPFFLAGEVEEEVDAIDC